MKGLSGGWRWVALGGVAVVGVAIGAMLWIVPRVIAGQVRSRYDGQVNISGWWIGGSSSGVKGLTLHESSDPTSPVWARAEAVETDLTIGGLLSGRTSPKKITLVRPALVFRIDRDGRPLTRPSIRGGSGQAGAMPEVIVRDGTVTLKQEGRPEMVVAGVSGRLGPPDADGSESFRADSGDSTWGAWEATGQFAPGFATGRITLKSVSGLVADADKTARIPFVPKEVWDHVRPSGPMGVAMTVTLGKAATVVTDLSYGETTLGLPSLGLVTTGTTGGMTIESAIVTLKGMRGQSLGGEVRADGTLDFSKNPSQFDLTLGLEGIDVTKAPTSWQLGEAEITGKLSGRADLVVALKESGADLTGSTGQATVSGGSIGGIPMKSMKLAMKAEGDDLQYKTAEERGAMLDRLAPIFLAIQAPASKDDAKPTPEKKAGGLILPKTISTSVEFEDVDLVQLIARAEAMGIHLPVPVAGKLSLKANATIPLGALKDVKQYAFHGEATLKGAAIDNVDLGRVSARLDLENGVLDLTDFRGRIVDRPDGGTANPPPPTEAEKPDAPLPPGGFLGRVHAEISPQGALTAHFEGNALPVGELAAPALPHPSPLSGLVTFHLDASGQVAKLSDTSQWTASGRAESRKITYRGTVLDAFSSTFQLKNDHLEMPDMAATLGGQPLKAGIALGLAAPNDFSAHLDVAGWDLSDILAFVPSAPDRPPWRARSPRRRRRRGRCSRST